MNNRLAKVWKPCEDCGQFFWGLFNETACKQCDAVTVSQTFKVPVLPFTRFVLALALLILPATAHALEGQASYYTVASCQSEGTSGVFTANGERYNEQALTCAVRNRRFGTEYLVYGHRTGKSVVVRHNDFGPGKGPTAKGVVIDLTPRAFQEVCGDLKYGKCEVSVQEVK